MFIEGGGRQTRRKREREIRDSFFQPLHPVRHVKGFNQARPLSGRYTVSGVRGCFRGPGEFSRSGLPYLRSLTRSRQFRNEIHGDPYSEAFTRRFSPRGRSFREPRLSPKSGYYAIYGLSGCASATLLALHSSMSERERVRRAKGGKESE